MRRPRGDHAIRRTGRRYGKCLEPRAILGHLTRGQSASKRLSDLEAVKAAMPDTLPVPRGLHRHRRATRCSRPEACRSRTLVLAPHRPRQRLGEQDVTQPACAFILELEHDGAGRDHSASEVGRAAELDARLIIVNARDLSTFEHLDRDLFGRLADAAPRRRQGSPGSRRCSSRPIAPCRRRRRRRTRRRPSSWRSRTPLGEALVANGAVLDPCTISHGGPRRVVFTRGHPRAASSASSAGGPHAESPHRRHPTS